MNTIQLITNNIWPELTKAAKQSKTKSLVSVAYFGQNGSKMLPLKKGSILVVDASEKALKLGQTCPDELLKLYYKGVHIFSYENLHAKLYIIGNSLYCGSANVSGNSSSRLKEVLLKTNNRIAKTRAKNFINSLCRIDLGEYQIKEMKKLYNPPKKFVTKKNYPNNKSSEFHIVNLRLLEWTDKEEVEAEKGRQVAKKSRINKSNHHLDEFSWGGKTSFKKGDNLLQITTDGDQKYVSPIGKLVHIRKWSNGKSARHICYVEVPDKRKKRFETVIKKLDSESAKAIKRAGRKREDLESRILKLWAK